MDRQLIKTLIDALEASALTELEYTRDGSTLRLVKDGGSAPSPAPARPIAGAATTPTAAPPPAPPPAPAGSAGDALVLAPLYGVVHLQRTPGAAPFVAPRQAVEAGQVLCTIEAMKVFTDVRAVRSGAVVEILAADGQEVEAGQPLMRLG